MASAANYRPLNVRDALTYLDQVKVQFYERPEVYNRFLDVMKEFKGQVIDTPGVIERVSNLFRGHPNLIQGFNTFLPPGYNIKCTGGKDGNIISVTTPAGTTSHIESREETHPGRPVVRAGSPRRSPPRAGGTAAAAAPVTAKVEPAAAAKPATTATAARTTGSTAASGSAAKPAPAAVTAERTSGANTPNAAAALTASAAGQTNAPPAAAAEPNRQAQAQNRHYMLEFNHAIAFVNKIKNRYNTDADTYKQFLEILQTYQREGKEITEVYDQVTKLFGPNNDLVSEFKQFLPEDGDRNMMGFNSIAQAAADSSVQANKLPPKPVPAPKKRKAPEPKATAAKKRATKADSPSVQSEPDVPAPPQPETQTLASAEEVAFFDKVKKYIDDKVTYHEFLKLINLFSQDLIDVPTLIDRAEHFIGNSPEVWFAFKKMVIVDTAGNPPANFRSKQTGYGFGGMIAVDGQMIENTPMLERVKPDLSGPRVKSYGPSYRKLPKTEVNLECSGRDALCWEVLNDEWVSHPTWAAEDAAPFMAHKKNIYEEALHKSEEERHEYDYHIEANLRTIALLEPLNNKLMTLEPAERTKFNFRAGLGAHSKSIYMRVIKKVYGKELGFDIIRAMNENPHLALPIVLERLKAKDDEWKKAQREWNRVWREQDAKNFYKALDHQGIQFKQTDKKTISVKNLFSEIDQRRREQTKLRSQMIDATNFRYKPQFEFDFADTDVLKDVVKLVISYLDRMNGVNVKEREKVETALRELVPLVWMLDKEDFDAEFGDAERASDDEDDSESDEEDADESSAAGDEDVASLAEKQAKKSSAKHATDLRKKLLKSAAGKDRERGMTATPAPDDDAATTASARVRSLEGTPATDLGDRAETPVPVPDDPEKVAQQVEKDKAQAVAGEQTWVDVIMPSQKEKAEVDKDGDVEMEESNVRGQPGGEIAGNKANGTNGTEDRRLKRKGFFFANMHIYSLIRLIQLLYARLLNCKQFAAQQAAERKRPINPIAIRLGLAETEQSHFAVQAGDNPAEHYYAHLLNMAEKLFENDVDTATFEETLRVMFGTKAYVMFTLDRVVAAIVKQTQTVAGDMRSQELIALLQRERQRVDMTVRHQIAYRYQAEEVVEEGSLYKIETIPNKNQVTISFMSKEDPTIQDIEKAEDSWRSYIDSYVLTHKTENLRSRVDAPLLKRNLADLDPDTADFDRTDGLSCRIAMGNYKMFAISGTEDYFHHKRPSTTSEKAEEEAAEQAAKNTLDEFVNKRIAALGNDI